MLFNPSLTTNKMERLLGKAKTEEEYEKIMTMTDEFSGKLRKFLATAASIKKVAREKKRSMERAKLRATVNRGTKKEKTLKRGKTVYRGTKKGKPRLWPGRCTACIYRFCSLAGGPGHDEKLCTGTDKWLHGAGGPLVKAHYNK